MTSAQPIDLFKADLLGDLEPKIVTQKYLLHGNCQAIDEVTYFELKSHVAQHLDIHPNEVLMVGSGKLGFSIAPEKQFNEFGDTSDIDLAIISPRLFDHVWENVFEFEQEGGYWEDMKYFKKCLYKGWVRPDLVPEIDFSKEWWEFFNSVNKSRRFGPYHVSAGIYKNWFFLEKYLSKCVVKCKESLNGN